MRISDWSSDVCSSDLQHPGRHGMAVVNVEPFQFSCFGVQVAEPGFGVVGSAYQLAPILDGLELAFGLCRRGREARQQERASNACFETLSVHDVSFRVFPG